MQRFGHSVRRLAEAAALGLLATAPVYLPPVSIAERLDGWMFDAWSQLSPATTAPGLAVATVETHASLARLTEVAARSGVDLIVATATEPVEHSTVPIIGPTEIAVDAERSRPTQWRSGGHLWFDAEIDGVVRRDVTLTRRGGRQPSLALVAARALSTAALPPPPGLLRLPRTDSIPTFDGDAAEPQLPEGARVVVAGPAARSYATPFGVATTPQLVAQVLSSHLGGHGLRTSVATATALWLVALLIAAALARPPTSVRRAALALGAGLTILIACSAGAFAWLDWWVPATGPVTWLALTGALLAAHKPRTVDVAPPLPEDARLARARQAAHRGLLKEAWEAYRSLPATPSLLPELYDLACALATRGADDEAADLFHRIVQIDAEYRDAARRLVGAAPAPDAGGSEPGDAVPATIGRYRVLARIGRGAMGSVYLARDPIINRIVALKAIDLAVGYELAGMETTAESFLREATIAGSLTHANIVTIFDVGEADGLAYIAMEYVRGHHLSEFTAPERLLPVTTVLDLVSRAADALDYAHRQNVVHRDIKPANIMYDSVSDSLKITDFGIAKLIDANRTRTGIVLGTPAYMSPEQLEGRNVNGHTDLFALGVSLYQLLTGQLPFRGASMTNLMFVIANEPHESVTRLRGDLPKWLDRVIDRALAKDPADRFQSGAEMAAALRLAA